VLFVVASEGSLSPGLEKGMFRVMARKSKRMR
jgi:hypothetical protein